MPPGAENGDEPETLEADQVEITETEGAGDVPAAPRATKPKKFKPEKPLALSAFSIIPARRQLSGSMIGGIAETQEMLDFCGQHSITSDIEIIPIQKINEAYERMLRSDVKYRFVIDMASLK